MEVASTRQGGGRRGHRIDAESAAGGHLVVGAYQCHGSNVGPMGVLRAGNGNETGGIPFIVQPEPVCVTGSVTHALTSEGADAGEDGTGRGTPIVAEAIAFTERGRGESTQTESSEELSFCLKNPGEGGRRTDRQVAYRLRAFGDYVEGEQSSTLKQRDYKDANDQVVGMEPAAVRYVVRRLTPRECERLTASGPRMT